MNFLKDIFKRIKGCKLSPDAVSVDTKPTNESPLCYNIVCFDVNREGSTLGCMNPADIIEITAKFVTTTVGKDNFFDAQWDFLPCDSHTPNTRFLYLVNKAISEDLKQKFHHFLKFKGVKTQDIKSHVYEDVLRCPKDKNTFDNIVPSIESLQKSSSHEAIIRLLKPR